jgi:hypothetical protein
MDNIDRDNERHKREEQERRAKRKVSLSTSVFAATHTVRSVDERCTVTHRASRPLTHTRPPPFIHKTGSARIQIGIPSRKRAQAERTRSTHSSISNKGRRTSYYHYYVRNRRRRILRLSIPLPPTRPRLPHHPFLPQRSSPSARRTVLRRTRPRGYTDRAMDHVQGEERRGEGARLEIARGERFGRQVGRERYGFRGVLCRPGQKG